MYQFKQVLKMDLKNLITNPMWIFYCTAYPFLITIILGFLASGSYGNTISSYDFYSITIMIYSVLSAATLAANSFMEKDIKGPNMRLIYSPVHTFTIHFSKVIATVIFTAALYTLTGFILFLLTGANFGGSQVIYFWLLMLVLDLFASALSILLCCLLKTEEAVNQLVSFFITFAAFLGGLFFPVNGFGNAIKTISSFCPVTWVTDASFQIIHDQDLTLFFPVVSGLILLSAVCIILSHKFFRTEDFI